jgi:hypothetical protein
VLASGLTVRLLVVEVGEGDADVFVELLDGRVAGVG